ncbi:hypothetical protein LPJ78_005578 [Coemansia sp. RSA 989]|nr:hypothetical protein BX667DRAFT_530451 [Coemansia mojavensis]KAJ1738557.1 hypothetical protein LPJ68_005454 [Coemansia sp. RSA 1086]KAJ1747012.1 hypothetical protein LPJ79_005546 [Coemansia sp. RSA 1821]KAJ1861023.1 hypothetical protein LPJ78_005578 [Coemansia sp. RSA 989]KAJ1869079.1 hypothetical protein LPJ55_005611 [Coemansia sp. RSA 990]KAJ2645914.1 hypothetical protein IWW40_005793 [Coemansia sp. RSA 1250]KAJ2669020.1 hypothetical protein IWW42_004860 [Coemansia sp. RSA 1085]
MPKKFKGENSKVTAANERKAAAKAEKDAKIRKQKEEKEAQEWQVGAKKNSKKEEQEAKRLEKLARKAEADKLLAEETKNIKGGKPKAAPKAKPAARGSDKKAAVKEKVQAAAEQQNAPVKEYQARNIDDALLLLDTVAEDVGEGPSTQKSQLVDRHPERRFKAALNAYMDKHFDSVKAENPGLRKRQIDDILFRRFKKSPENPFNQVHVAHNATSAQIDSIVEEERKRLESQLEIK